MEYRYTETSDIKVSVGMTTGQIKQIINFLHDANQAADEGFSKDILMSRIMELEQVYEQAMFNIETYAQGQKKNV
jgi:hypothetical protein